MAEPTVVSYGNADFGDIGTANDTVAGVSWVAGDLVLVFGATSANELVDMLGTPTVTGGSGTGLTFSQSVALNNDTASNDAQMFFWTATAGGTGSGTIQSVQNSVSTGNRHGIAVFVMRGSDGLGTPQTIDNSSAKTISVTRGYANSHVLMMMTDYNQANDVAVDATPTGTVRLASAQSGQADFFVLSFGDQGSTGTTAYGITNHTGTVDMTGIAVEVRGTGSSPGTLSSATPSGTLGTSTTATLGATTTEASGTFYGVVDTAGNISGITAAQVKAGQNNASASAVAASNSAVSGTTPSTGVTGLTAATAYSYAVVQNSAGGDSNVLTGTFTTAASSSPSRGMLLLGVG